MGAVATYRTGNYCPSLLPPSAFLGGQCGLDAFEQLIGPVDTVQAEWHAYVRRLKAALAGNDLEFFKAQRRSEAANAPAEL